MAERPDDRRFATSIVPDPESSLSHQRLRQPPPNRTWPLWLLIVLLIGAFAALAWMGFEERNRLEREVSRLGGELSNVHARFDAEQGSGDALDSIEERISALLARDDSMAERIEALEDESAARLDDIREQAASQSERINRVEEAATTRDALMAASRVSLNALERAGEEGRSALDQRLSVLAEDQDRHDQRLDSLTARLDDVSEDTANREAMIRLASRHDDLEERITETEDSLGSRLDELAARLATLDDALEEADTSRDDIEQRSAATADRISALASEIGELRRSQLALSAQIEALQP
ncbi:hypothetical protein [Halomonas urumqiensis]|uniref:Uncharacterized protein n=1 Tax=Halomonas urumqiensis TaxID=1684789 RepID=A0A2N7UET9_9GAMM|nr:hypothetical protein [Halomonas urumqiensis]PMR78930.1 hypothetical protein C1H70_14320 [Halomonas urumqiensis]PTB04165.1 hypothetical protein C6V82_06865 [Halomonas urumqiensis]GHE19566.1 hypothetical protein GCM10017767_00870 [Halomonas urumqiensis]